MSILTDIHDRAEERMSILQSEQERPHCFIKDIECKLARNTMTYAEWGGDPETNCRHPEDVDGCPYGREEE